MTNPAAPSAPAPAPPDPISILQSRSYVALLVLGALIGVPVAATAYFFLEGVAEVQELIFTDLPDDLGFDGVPLWWPLPWLALSGLLVALAIQHLPGTGGHEPSEGFKSGGPLPPIELFGVVAAAFATLSLGVVLGPEAPLIAIGNGLGVLAVHLVKRGSSRQAVVVIGVAGSFAAIATLLGSTLAGAFLLMEVVGLGGTMLEIVLVPGLLAAGIGSLIFVGLDNLTGFGLFALTISDIPEVGSPTGAEFLWAIGIGAAASLIAAGIFRLAQRLRPLVEQRRVLLTPLVGVAVGGVAIAFEATTDRNSSNVLFSGQDALPSLIQQASGWSVGALLMLILCKGLAYALSLSSFRGGPIFPAMYIGAAGGIALSHVGGSLPPIAGAAMGVGAMTAAALKMPLTAALLPSILFASDAANLVPLVIVAVVVSYVLSVRINPNPADPPVQDAHPASIPPRHD